MEKSSYEELMEDLHDLNVIIERKDEDVISFEDIKRELKTKGFIKNLVLK